MENKGTKKNGGKSSRKSPQGSSPSKEIPQVHLMSRAGSRTRKYEERSRRAPVAALAPVWAPSPAPVPAPVTLNRHRAMPAQPTTHAGLYPHQNTFPVEAKGKTALPAYGASSSASRTNGTVGTVEVCESCSCSFYPNDSGNSKDAFLFGDKYCTACLLAFQRK